jgi:hypothetical protein
VFDDLVIRRSSPAGILLVVEHRWVMDWGGKITEDLAHCWSSLPPPPPFRRDMHRALSMPDLLIEIFSNLWNKPIVYITFGQCIQH